jgi:succinoglycan biosynthesis protein ExoA
VGGKEGPAETAYLGTFQRHRLVEVGLFDEGIKRGQDWELNRRLRGDRGHRLVHAGPSRGRLPAAVQPQQARAAIRRDRESGAVSSRGAFPRENGLRYFVPPVAVLGIVLAGIVLGIIGAANNRGSPSRFAAGRYTHYSSWWRRPSPC